MVCYNQTNKRIWTIDDDKRQNDFYEMCSKMPIPQWLKDMHEHYNEHGFYRPEDLERVLGDPTKGVSIPLDNEDISRHFLDNLNI